MYELKGGRELLLALPEISQQLERPVEVTFAGDGAQRAEWEGLATRICARHPRVHVSFTGWIDHAGVNDLFRRSDLLVVPSLWPEPFGLVGLEAGRFGVPAAAFAVGGIPDWLQSGVNGFLAPGDPPTVDGLTQAVVACLENERVHAALRQGARQRVTSTLFDTHASALLGVFADVTQAA
jgi:glycosyltransferase involved in cell wall biosynthesis